MHRQGTVRMEAAGDVVVQIAVRMEAVGEVVEMIGVMIVVMIGVMIVVTTEVAAVVPGEETPDPGMMGVHGGEEEVSGGNFLCSFAQDLGLHEECCTRSIYCCIIGKFKNMYWERVHNVSYSETLEMSQFFWQVP